MTDHSTAERAAAEAQRARLEALRQRRPSPTGASAPPADGTAPRWQRRRHPAERSRVGVAAASVATMLGLVGVMGLTRPASSATPNAPVETIAAPTTGPAPAPAAPATAAPPVALTARPSVQAATATAPVARTNGSR